jgi:flavin-dependent dehydrogenase
LLVEQDHFPRHKVCGEFLSPEAQETLSALGLYPALAGLHPQSLTQVTLHAPNRAHLSRPLPGAAWGISRYAMDAALAQAAVAAGVTLRTGTVATQTTRQADAYSVTLRHTGHTQTVRTRMVLIAAGRQSRAALTPTAPAPKSRRRGSRAVGIKSHYRGLAVTDQVELFLFAGGYAGINPVESGHANLCLLVEEQAFRAAGGTVAGILHAAGAHNPALAERLADATPLPDTLCTVGAVDTGAPACPWQALPRLGDAVVMLPPLCGDGMAMALRGAELCVDGADAYLHGRTDLEAWATAYTHAWRAEFAPRVRLARGLQRLFMTPSLTGGLLSLGNHLPWAADYFVRATRGPVTSASATARAASG